MFNNLQMITISSLFLMCGCRGSIGTIEGDSDTDTVTDIDVCGNNLQEGTEECDGADLAGQTCVTQGFDSGTLTCSSCTYDTSNCVTTPAVCGDSICEAGETCGDTNTAPECNLDCGACPALFDSALFLATFEDGTTDADIGEDFPQTSEGVIEVVDNPDSTGINTTSRVLRTAGIEGDNVNRAEYHTSVTNRIPTINKTYFYAWKEYYPLDFFDDKTIYWLLTSQWKTWPCPIDENDPLTENICYPGGGIFNERQLLASTQEQDFRFRAKPDCETYTETDAVDVGVWHSYVLEIYWTSTVNDQDGYDGYYNIYKDGVLIHSTSGVKTLFDGLPTDGSCDIAWGMGVYAYWVDEGAGSLERYIDDMAVFDVDAGATIEDVLAWQGY